MKVPSILWKDINLRAKKTPRGCWKPTRVQKLWKKLGSPRRLTASKVARASLKNRYIPRTFVLRWCVGLLNERMAKRLFKKLDIPTTGRKWKFNSGPFIFNNNNSNIITPKWTKWNGRNVYSSIRDWVNFRTEKKILSTGNETHNKRMREVLQVISKLRA